MTALELIRVLAEMPPHAHILIPSYERRWDRIDTVRIAKARRRNPGDTWWDGEYQVGARGELHVLIASSRRIEFAKGTGE